MLAAFPTDIGSREHTLHGKLHLAIAALAFISIAVAELLLSRSLAGRPEWRRLGERLVILANVTILAFVLLVVGARAPAIGGLTERIFLAAALLWMVVAALGLRDVDTTPLEAAGSSTR